MTKRGRPKAEIEDTWIPPIRESREKPETAVKALANLKRTRLLAGYKKLYKLSHDEELSNHQMKAVHRLADRLGF
jgi:hypothetical protein